MLDTVDVVTPLPPPLTAVAVEPLAPPAPTPVRWPLATRVAFRFCFLYFSLYVLTTQMLGGMWIADGLRPPNMGATGWMAGPIAWTATHVFHVKYQYQTVLTGSGDKAIDWIHAFLLLVFSAAATALWSVLDRRRPNYVSMHKWFEVFMRLAAGATMVGYGMVKAIPLQMPAPQLTRLLERYGDFSPMGVLWYSIGASFPYERFAGSMELAAAVMLFIPRLSVLGAMVLVADSVQIFALNMTYDVPVKLFSFHLILFGLVLLAPHVPRLTNALVFNRVAQPSPVPPLVRNRIAVYVLLGLQLFYGGIVLYNNYSSARQGWFSRGAGAAKPPLYGIWDIEKMSIDGVERAPLITDWARWRRLVIQTGTGISFQRMDDTVAAFPATTDTAAKTIVVTKSLTDKTQDGKFAYQQPAPDILVLDGELSGHKIHMETRLFDKNKFLLIRSGFHWINERPFNR